MQLCGYFPKALVKTYALFVGELPWCFVEKGEVEREPNRKEKERAFEL